MSKIILICIALLFNISYSQQKILLEGKITFQSSENIYAEFQSTDGIAVSDTIFFVINNIFKPLMTVQHISSKSVSGRKIGDVDVANGDRVVAFIYPVNDIESKVVLTEVKKDTTLTDIVPVIREIKYAKTDRYSRGRVSVQSYSTVSNIGGDYARSRVVFSFFTNDIVGSRITFNNYITYNYSHQNRAGDNSFAKNLKVYDLSLAYPINEKNKVEAGRFIASDLSNLGAVDGILFSADLSYFKGGVVIGSRPNFSDYGYNIKLPQAGLFISRKDTAGSSSINNSFALFQQMNGNMIDRRFFYIQHSNDLIPFTTFFFSSEVDLYKKEIGESKTDFTPVSLYFSARVRPSKILSVDLSYDARKNVIYYETYKSFIDTHFVNETRHGFRFGTSVRIDKNIFTGITYGYRYSKSDPQASKSYNGYFAYNSLPLINSDAVVNFMYLNNYLSSGSNIGIKFNRTLFNGDLTAGLEYRYVNWKFHRNDLQLNQNILGAEVYYKLMQSLYLSVNYETIFAGTDRIGRVFAELTTRF